MDDIKRIVYGKDSTENIVNISVKNNLVYLFRELNGETSYKTIPYKHWVLSPKAYPGYTPLKGKQYYQYIKEYNRAEDFEEIRRSSYKLNLYSLRNYSEAFMIKNGYTYFKNTKVEDISTLSFDIETTGLDPDAFDAKVLLITNTLRKNNQLVRKTFNVEEYETQQDMINDWSMWVIEKDPTILVGHNIIVFDLPYINRQMEKAGMPLYLGRFDEPIEFDEKIKELRVSGGGQTYSYRRITIFGREIVDTFFLALKADIAKKYTSYGLKAIVKQEGWEKEGRQHYDASKIRDQWSNLEERKKIIQYAEEDSDDALKVYDKLIPSFFILTSFIPKTFQSMIESATGGQLNSLMVRSYLQDGFCVARGDEIADFDGAISMGIPGIYENVLKVDVKSQYPSIMLAYKIFPVGKDFNGNFLKMLEYFTLERFTNQDIWKSTGDVYYSYLEQAMKVVINSAYGFMGASGLNYNYEEGAALVTKYGREVIIKSIIWATGYDIKKVVKKIKNKGKPNEEIIYEWVIGDKVTEGKGFHLVNADTDSISITNQKDISKEDQTSQIQDLNSNYPEAIRFSNDGYFKKVVVLAAKNYILYDGKKIKLKGSSLKDQKKEPALREMLDKMINCLVFDNPNDAISVYNNYIKECLNVNNISRWAAKKTVSKAILNCATDPEARLNERNVYDAVKDIKIQEGDKVYLYQAILDEKTEVKQYKNGNIKEKVIKTTCLKRVDVWKGDHDVDKLIERVYDTADILSPVLDMSSFKNYSNKKNKLDLLSLT